AGGIAARSHGGGGAEEPAAEFARVFAQGALPDDVPEVNIAAALDGAGMIGVVDLVLAVGLAPSRNEARRLITHGAVRLDEAKITDPAARVPAPQGGVLRVGKRGFARLLTAAAHEPDTA
ncbi:MAG: tyrosine--tRNA ligase, partial [Candidatus Marinimicrobia bacterium]|nr:tyrosine--tRNA ligase [Candidatus Neomarinimicrobiota bacterium]